jgi:hypothetical protein
MTNVSRMGLLSPADFLTRTDKSVPNLVRCEMRVLFRLASQGNKTLLDRVQITRLKVSTSQLRYALRASEQQIQEAINLKPGQHMLIDLYPPQEL